MGMVTAIALFWSNKPNPAIVEPTARFELAVYAQMPTVFAVVALYLYVHVDMCARTSSLRF
jgi:hypothetical protein